MLTTTLDGLWVLQVLTGIEVLAPELGLRPHLPSIEAREIALLQPVTAELRAANVIDGDDRVDETVVEWLTVLARRDVAVLLYVQTPPGVSDPERILLARFAQWWVSLERYGNLVRLGDAGTATSEYSAALLLGAQIERICGRMEPASLRPATLDIAEILSAVKDPSSLRDFLRGTGLDAYQQAVLSVAADGEQSAQASLIAIQGGAGGEPTRSHIESGVVTIMDTPQGRVLSEIVKRGGKSWMVVSPGSPTNISSAVLAMLRNLPSHEYWHSYRKVV